MKEFFKDKTEYGLNCDFQEIKDLLYMEIPGGEPIARCINMPSPLAGFVMSMKYLEKLFFQDDFESNNTYQSCYNRKHQSHRVKDLENEVLYKSGFSYTNAPSTQYYEVEGSTHLEAAESLFKITPNHFLRISTKNNILFVYTNKELPFKTFCALKLLQWELTKDNITTPCPEVLEFINHVMNEEWEEANKTIHELFHSETFKSFKYEKLNTVFQPNHQKLINSLQNSIQQKENDYNYWINEISRMAAELSDLKERLWIVKTQEEKQENNKALLKYLLNHPYIKEVTKLSNEQVLLYYEAPIIYFDDWIIKKIYHNYPEKDQKIFDIFLKNEYELMTHCAVKFNTQTFKVERGSTNWDDPFIGHPHIDRYNCFGNHHRAIHEAALENNYFGAIEQISQAVFNLNFSDSTVIEEMCYNLKGDSTKPTWRNKETGEILCTEEVWEVYKNEETQINNE